MLDRTFEGTTGTLQASRQAASEFVAESGAPSETVENVRLVVSELTANAVQASPGFPYRLSIRRASEQFIVSITNHAHPADLPPRRDWGPKHTLAPRGRGLAIVERLAESVEFGPSGPEGLEITAHIAARISS